MIKTNKVMLQPKKYAPSYPYLAESSLNEGLIVLFSDFKTGTVLEEGDSHFTIGYQGRNWDIATFTPLNKSVTIELSNL